MVKPFSWSPSSWFIIFVCRWRIAVYLLETSVVLLGVQWFSSSIVPAHLVVVVFVDSLLFCTVIVPLMLLHFFWSFCWLTHFPTTSWGTLLLFKFVVITTTLKYQYPGNYLPVFHPPIQIDLHQWCHGNQSISNRSHRLPALDKMDHILIKW